MKLTLDDFDRVARTVPVLANVRPGGQTYLMEDFHFAGGLPGFLSRIPDLLHLDRPTVCHDTLRDQLAGARVHDDDVIRTRDNPVAAEGGVAVLRGNLCPDGAVIKHIAAEPHLLAHRARRRLRRLQGDAADHQRPGAGHHRRQCAGAAQRGPQGRPGHARVRHAAAARPSAQAGRARHGPDLRRPHERHELRHLRAARRTRVVRRGPLALVRTGDPITLDVENRTLTLDVDDEELNRRRAEWTPPPARYERGYGALYNDQITQADTGCDFEFLARPGTVQDPYAG